MRFIVALSAALFMFAQNGYATVKPLVADVSRGMIDIDSTYDGTSILLFGASSEPGELLVVVRGPERTFTVRKKEKVGGIWVNTKQQTFKNLPSFFATASNSFGKKLPESVKAYSSFPDEFSFFFNDDLDTNEFANALREKWISRDLLDDSINQINFMGDTLFRTNLEFPANITRGIYTAEVYLVNDRQIIGMESIPIDVRKTGLDAFLFDMAHKMPGLYGVISILLALAGGAAASRLFQRNNV